MTKIQSLVLPMVLALVCTDCGSGSVSTKVAKADNERQPAPALPAGQVAFPENSPKLGQIRVHPVDQAEVPIEEINAPGKVEANPNRTSHVSLPVPGRLVTVAVRIGDFVHEGQPLITVESPDVDAALSTHIQAVAGVTQAKSALTKAQADLDRTRDLFAHDAVAQKEVINAEAVLTQSKAALEQAEAAVTQSKRRLDILGVQPGKFGQRMTIHAPISGKVLEMDIVPGEYRNDVSQPMMTIADLSTVWVTADVPESSIRLVKVGDPVRIELAAYPGESFAGKVKQIADLVDPQTRTIKVRAELINRDGRLRPEMFGRIRLTGATAIRPLVPTSAVIEGEGQNVVWRETAPGKFQKTKIKLGEHTGDKVAVLSGLNAGDRIVTDGVMLLQSN